MVYLRGSSSSFCVVAAGPLLVFETFPHGSAVTRCDHPITPKNGRAGGPGLLARLHNATPKREKPRVLGTPGGLTCFRAYGAGLSRVTDLCDSRLHCETTRRSRRNLSILGTTLIFHKMNLGEVLVEIP